MIFLLSRYIPQPLNLVSCPEELLCSVEEIEELLYSLQPDKSIGFDGVSPRMLKSTACSIAPSLTKNFSIIQLPLGYFLRLETRQNCSNSLKR